MEGLILHLRSLGFTEMEAKIVVSLSEQGAMTGYEVAKKLGVSRSNVYAALQRLVDQGLILHQDGEPSYYAALQPEELTRILASRLESSLRYVKHHMPATEVDETSFYSVEGERAVNETIKRALHEAKREIIVDVWPEEAAVLREELELAEARGVKVLWSIVDADAEGRKLIRMQAGTDESGIQSESRHFAFVIDRKETLIGARGEGLATKALLTEHDAVTNLVLGRFVQDIVLYELEQEMGLDLRRTFGERFEHVIHKYFD
ncbi:MarR family transcriptional regulator [Paenibacillus profundus]|uniref:MarR family transcriptional regulator n=1 Tax=Paenibacillus profundus TaxID=1173085 RepID=A0ABS8YDQ2_9BACL|nr:MULTISPECIES: TrmB family transcriptional regulator [Paenibacillus]MCE5168578.1 MarR family transcriptional regulator [Paenibacillus profundus]MCM3339165.1 MarR family transcriptional regulator [Paenibacillus sp. MER TA 81-3]